jgi:hypothetical protein
MWGAAPGFLVQATRPIRAGAGAIAPGFSFGRPFKHLCMTTQKQR